MIKYKNKHFFRTLYSSKFKLLNISKNKMKNEIFHEAITILNCNETKINRRIIIN